jgi:hypothetical protein
MHLVRHAYAVLTHDDAWCCTNMGRARDEEQSIENETDLQCETRDIKTSRVIDLANHYISMYAYVDHFLDRSDPLQASAFSLCDVKHR